MLPTPPHPRTDPSTHYRVRRGDTLSEIAQAHRTPGGYPAIAATNAINDVNMIYQDDVLTLPTSPRPQQQERPRIQGPSPTLSTPRVQQQTTTATATPTRTATRSQPSRDAADPRVNIPEHPTSHSHATAVAGSSRIIAEARLWIGSPYRYGGNSRRGVDCSGLVQEVFRSAGTILPRTAREQMAAAKRITRAEARPGDLVGNPTGSHIAIYLGNGQMIDAPQSGGRVGVRPLYRDMTVFGRIS